MGTKSSGTSESFLKEYLIKDSRIKPNSGVFLEAKKVENFQYVLNV